VPEQPVRILFVCVGNMCRSPLAEAFARHHGGSSVRAESAGLSATGQIHPFVRDVLRERGVPDRGLRSKPFDSVDPKAFDVVVSIAGIRAEAFLPEGWTGDARAWAIADPIGKPRPVFEDCADDVEAHVLGLLKELGIVAAGLGITAWAGMDGPGIHEEEALAAEEEDE
jgi:arsenate reductase (thioredoxin)